MSDEPTEPREPAQPVDLSKAQPAQPSFGRWMGSMWLYTLLRFGMFFVLWGLLVLIGLTGLFAALIALVLSVPLSLVLLRKPRDAFTAQLQARLDARHAARADLDARLDPDASENRD
jgi:O-antigen ligase